MTDALTPHERRQHAEYLVEAVLAAAFGERDEAKRLLALADRALPVSDELYHAVLDPPIDPDDIKNTDLYQELEEKYQTVCNEFAAHLEGQITAYEEGHEAINNRIVRLERDNPEWK